ncbi:glycerol-3-phosphate dehydrogenase/oxidase [Amaricoccus sp.]|uniref:glycerol-3-phosphate dehydrogenase/oxidase n=1 Tax=Amaricoccus sp. TaxID=1872485 RepID=UPI001B6846E9|nr:glycerol-3-phosphate dehydrogenase/oxidase [Amaricoccus sp.]MBP7243196.1 glycerol-3-phosphate dehydrogenase/oxidase [Amaricoccus sp.]
MTIDGHMDREAYLARLRSSPEFWDIIVVGGGATGLGTALEAVSRGYRTLLLEQDDFAKATSSRSTKLVHGGVRYLQQGNVSLVMEALRERGRLLANAPHVAHNLPFVVPIYDWWEGPFYGVGMKLYDLLAGKLGLGPSKLLSREETLARLPNIEAKGLRNGVIYHDGQFDDARLAICLARTIADKGGVPLNHVRVTELRKRGGNVVGVRACDVETGEAFELDARVVVNATGIFSDDVRQMDDPAEERLIAPSQGVHLVLDGSFLAGDSAIMVPKTADGRVLFAVPWHGRTIVGTTDTEIDDTPLEPRAREEEIAFLLEHAAIYLDRDPKREDVLSVYCGVRPLVRTAGDKGTAALARDHVLMISKSNLVTITGGKWTTYRKMAEDAVDTAALVAGLDERPSETATMRLHGWLKHPVETDGLLSLYGSDAPAVRRTMRERPGWDQLLHPRLPYFAGEVAWAARNEMAWTVEDVLARRTRALLLDARASIEAAPAVAAILAEELGRDAAWQQRQLDDYRTVAEGYVLS